jgi:hypothetical protein
MMCVLYGASLLLLRQQLAQAVVQQLAALLPGCCVYTGVLLPGGQAIRYIPQTTYIPPIHTHYTLSLV